MSAQAAIPFFYASNNQKNTLETFVKQLKFDSREFLKALFTIKYWWMLTFLFGGCISFSIVVNGILIPHNFFAGGVTGLGLSLIHI